MKAVVAELHDLIVIVIIHKEIELKCVKNCDKVINSCFVKLYLQDTKPTRNELLSTKFTLYCGAEANIWVCYRV